MKYYIDTEFIEHSCTIDLISIGIVAEDRREFYAISSEFEEAKASQWVKDNVIAKLSPRPKFVSDGVWMPRWMIKENILDFIGDDKRVEFWGYYADYDWVVFCWLFGTMMELPKGFPMYCRDIKQLADEMGGIRLPNMGGAEHNALDDAKEIKMRHAYLIAMQNNLPTTPRGAGE